MTLEDYIHPKIWIKYDKEDIILYALSTHGPLTPSDFIRGEDEEGWITKTTFYQHFNKLRSKKYVYTEEDEKNRKRVKYLITNMGEIYLDERLSEYGLDFQSRLNREKRRSKNLINQMKVFFQKHRITDDELRMECINLASIISLEKLIDFLKDEGKYFKILLFLALNHPKFYPSLSLSVNEFISQYNSLNENAFSKHEIGLFLEKLVEKNEYNIEFHKIKVQSEGPINLYFAADSEYGKLFKETVDSHLKGFIHKTNLGIIQFNQEGLMKCYNDIIITLVDKYQLFNRELKDSLFHLINQYRSKIRENLIRQNRIVLEYAKTSELPELPLKKEKIIKEDAKIHLYHESITFEEQKQILNYDSIKDQHYFSKIWELYNNDKEEEALDHINKVIELEEIPELYFWKADILRYINPKEALEVIDKGIKINPIPLGYNFFLLKAGVLVYIGNYEDALKAIDLGLELDNDISLFKMKAEILLNLGRIEDCIDLADKLGILSFEYINDIISKKAGEGMLDKTRASTLVDIVLKRDPNHLNSLAVKARLLFKSQNFKDASKIIDKILAYEFDYKSFNLYDIAVILIDLERHKKALNLIQIIMEHTDYLQYADPYVSYYYAVSLKALNRLEEALFTIENWNFDPFDGLILKSEILLEMEKHDEALHTINEFFELSEKADMKVDSDNPFKLKVKLLILTDNSDKVVDFLEEIDEKILWGISIYSIKLLIDHDSTPLAQKANKKFCDVAKCSEESEVEFYFEIHSSYYNEVLKKINSMDFNNALRIIKLFTKFAGKQSDFYKLKIEVFIQQEKFEDAIILVNEAIALWPKMPVFYPPEYWIGDNDCPESEKIYHYEFCRLKVRILTIMERYKKALDLINKVIKLSPKLSKAYYLKTVILSYSENFESALEQINSTIDLESSDYTASHYYYVKSEILRKLSRDSEALDPINKAIEFRPKSKYYLDKSKILIKLGNNMEALETIEEGIKSSPNYSEFYEVKNLVLNLLGRYKDALIGIEDALNRGIQYDGIYFEKARLLHSQNNYEVALDTINKALVNNPHDNLSITLKIRILTKQERYEEALLHLENRKYKIHKDGSNSDIYMELKADIYYTQAKVLARNNMREEAIEAIENATQLTDPESAEYINKNGEILMNLRDFSSAAEKFELALQLDNPPLETKILLGTCYYEMRKYDDAYIYLDEGKAQLKEFIKEHNIIYGDKTEQEDRTIQEKPIEIKQIEDAGWKIASIESYLYPELVLPDYFTTEILFNIAQYIVKNGKYSYAKLYFERARDMAIERNEPEWIEKIDIEIKKYNTK